MKSNVRVQALTLLVASGIMVGTAACTRTEKETVAETTTTTVENEAESAYTDFKNFVEETESKTEMATYDATRNWNQEIADQEAAYNQRLANLDKYARTYDENRRTEIETMKTRYNTYWDARRNEYQGFAYRSEMRQKLLNMDSPEPELANLTAANIRNTYENFVKMVENNKENYTNQDWDIVEQTWNELDARKNLVQEELSAKDKYEIGKAKTKYIAMKAASKTANTAESGAEGIESGAKSAGSAIGNAAEQTGSAIKSGAKAVGKGAKKVGSETKDLYKKGEDKVDGTNDRK